jgi:hypothetical protein
VSIAAEQEWAALDYYVTGLRGKRLRVLAKIPTDGMAPVDLPVGITDVIAVDDEPDVFSNIQVHPVGDPSTVANVRYDQLALYAGQ